MTITTSSQDHQSCREIVNYGMYLVQLLINVLVPTIMPAL
jgi:hypothetical protein